MHDDLTCTVSLPEVGRPGAVAEPMRAAAGGDGPMESAVGEDVEDYGPRSGGSSGAFWTW